MVQLMRCKVVLGLPYRSPITVNCGKNMLSIKKISPFSVCIWKKAWTTAGDHGVHNKLSTAYKELKEGINMAVNNEKNYIYTK